MLKLLISLFSGAEHCCKYRSWNTGVARMYRGFIHMTPLYSNECGMIFQCCNDYNHCCKVSGVGNPSSQQIAAFTLENKDIDNFTLFCHLMCYFHKYQTKPIMRGCFDFKTHWSMRTHIIVSVHECFTIPSFSVIHYILFKVQHTHTHTWKSFISKQIYLLPLTLLRLYLRKQFITKTNCIHTETSALGDIGFNTRYETSGSGHILPVVLLIWYWFDIHKLFVVTKIFYK